MSENKNSIIDIKEYLGTSENPVKNQELKDFWGSLTEEEKMEFKRTELK